MIKIIPKVKAGDVLVLLMPCQLSNGLTAPADVGYEVTHVYPGGCIIKSPTGEHPGGLVKDGTPVYVQGDPAPTPEELAQYVHEGGMTTEVLGDKKDLAEDAHGGATPEPKKKSNLPIKVAIAATNDYGIDPSKVQEKPRQLNQICKILVATGKTVFTDEEVKQILDTDAVKTLLKTRQTPYSIFKYYRKQMDDSGFLSLIKKVPAIEVKNEKEATAEAASE